MTITATIGESAEQRQAREAAAAAAAAADADRSTYQEIDDRTWALVAKDPKSHIAEKFAIFGKVTQFGWTCRWPSQCRGAVPQDYSYKEDVNTMVDADNASAVADVVQDDILKMYMKVEGALTYSTRIGGSATVPQVAIKSFDLVGHDD